MERHKYGYLAHKQTVTSKKSKSRSRTRSMRFNSEDEGLLPIPCAITRHNSEDFLAKSRTESPKINLNRRSPSVSQEKRKSCNFRLKYYRSLGVVGTPAYRPPSPSVSEPRVPIEKHVARDDFDWKCESPALQSILCERPLSPLKGEHTGIFELEE